MIKIRRTDSDDSVFAMFVRELDIELTNRDREAHVYCAPFNKTDSIKYVVIACWEDEPAGCAAIREYSSGIMEIKRMFVLECVRRKGVALAILKELENWAVELGAEKCILETGERLPEAILLYEKKGYYRIDNYGQYKYIERSICYEKVLLKRAV